MCCVLCAMNCSAGPVTDRTAGETRLADLQERCSNMAGFKAGFCGAAHRNVDGQHGEEGERDGPGGHTAQVLTSCRQTSVYIPPDTPGLLSTLPWLSASRNRWRTATAGRAKQDPICKNLKRDRPAGRSEVCWPAGEKCKPAWLENIYWADGQIKVNQVIIAVDQI